MSNAFSVDNSAVRIAMDRLVLKEALEQLSPFQLIVLHLRYTCELPQSDVAERLQITQGWVSILERKALDSLRAFFLEE